MNCTKEACPMMSVSLIKLTKGKFTMVDTDDYDKSTQKKWGTQSCGPRMYAAGKTKRANGKQKDRWLHREIMNAPADMQVDHINGNGLDNRKSNLRLCTNKQNAANKRRRKGSYTSNFKGVCWHKGAKKWQSKIKHNYVSHHIGNFNSECEAARAYNKKAVELFGEFACLNDVA